MTASLFARVPFDDRRPRGRIELRADAPERISTQAFDWPAMLLEAGRNQVTAVEDVALAHHYLALNSDHRPVTLHGVNDSNGRRDVTLRPGTAWVLPAGDAVTLSLDALFTYVRVTIDPRHVDELLRGTRPQDGVELRRTFGISSAQLRHLLMALVAEADARNPGGLAFVEMLTTAVSHQLALHAGVERPGPQPARGGLSPATRRRVLELIDAKLDARLSIHTLAREAGLSPAHFARAFKQTIGSPPHRFLLSRRLERARHMLERPEAQLSDVALRSGFADQAHFTRHFKRQFGMAPGALTRRRRR